MSGRDRTLSAEALRCTRYAPTEVSDLCSFCGCSREEHPLATLVWHAAPELAEALEGLVRPHPNQEDYEQALDVASAALKKAGRLR